MKKRIVMALSLALLSSMAIAQPAAQPASAPAGGTKPTQKVAPPAQLKNDLDLTDEQVKKMREIRDGGGTREEMQAVLTPEQRAKQEALRKEHRGDRKVRMKQSLGLSDAQMKQMQEIRRKGGTREEMRAVMTPEQQAKFDARRSQHSGSGPKPAKKAPAAKPATSYSTPAAPTSAAPAATAPKTSE
jgi:Spy/CpxP family protein refolding chaperone